MITTSNLAFDTRILNEAKTLAPFYEVRILAFKSQFLDSKKSIFDIKQVPCRKNSLFCLFKYAYKEKTDIYHAHDLDGLLCAFLPALIKRKTLVYDSHELWSEATQFKKIKSFRAFFRILEKILILKVKYIITVNQTLSIFLKKKYNRTTLSLYNFPVTTIRQANNLNLKKLYPEKKIIIYLGGFTRGRGLKQIIEAANLLTNKYMFLFIGYGNEKNNLQELIKKRSLENKVQILDPFPPDKIIGSIEGVDLGLSLIENISKSYYFSSPNKIFQYVNAGVPILGSNFPEMKKLILKDKIGLVVSPNNPKLIAKKIIEMVKVQNQKKYRQNLKKVGQKYTWENESIKLLKFYQNILKELEKKIYE